MESLQKRIASGEGSQTEYTIDVVDGRVIYTTENTGFAFMRKGPDERVREIQLEELKGLLGAKHYEATKAEVERQKAQLRGPLSGPDVEHMPGQKE